MRRLSIVSMTLLLVLSTAGTFAAGEDPPPYPAGSDVTFEPAEQWAWRALEPAWDCGSQYPREPFYGGAEVAADGRVWFLDPIRGIRELGACPIVAPKETFGIRDQALGPDGTLWLLNEDRLWWWDGSEWHVRHEGFNQPGRSSFGDGSYSTSTDCDLAPCFLFVDVAPDGTVWLSGTVLSAFDGTGWTDYVEDRSLVQVIGFDPDGAVWVQGTEGVYVIEPGAVRSVLDSRVSAASPAATLTGEPAPPLGSIPSLRIDAETWSGSDWVARLDPVMRTDANAIRGVQALITAAGSTLADLTIGTGIVEPQPGNYAAVSAVRTRGLGFDLIGPTIAAMAPHIEDPQVRWEQRSGRWVAVVHDGTMPGAYPMSFYPAGDTTWVLQADHPLVETIVAAIPAASGQEVPLGQRVEVPAAAIAVSFPDDWTVWTDEADLGFIVPSGPERFGADVLMQPILRAEPAGQASGGFPSACTLVSYRPASQTPTEFLAELYGRAEDVDIETLGSDLSAAHLDELVSTGQRVHAQYAKDIEGGVALLWCWSEVPREDLWRSIAESIEPLPAAQ